MRMLNDGTPILRVIVWYADGSRPTVTTHDAWCSLPDGIVLVQVLYDFVRKGKYLQDVLAGHDWYWWHAGNIDNTRANAIPRECQASAVKLGAQIADDVFIRQYNEACEGVFAEAER